MLVPFLKKNISLDVIDGTFPIYVMILEPDWVPAAPNDTKYIENASLNNYFALRSPASFTNFPDIPYKKTIEAWYWWCEKTIIKYFWNKFSLRKGARLILIGTDKDYT